MLMIWGRSWFIIILLSAVWKGNMFTDWGWLDVIISVSDEDYIPKIAVYELSKIACLTSHPADLKAN